MCHRMYMHIFLYIFAYFNLSDFLIQHNNKMNVTLSPVVNKILTKMSTTARQAMNTSVAVVVCWLAKRVRTTSMLPVTPITTTRV